MSFHLSAVAEDYHTTFESAQFPTLNTTPSPTSPHHPRDEFCTHPCCNPFFCEIARHRSSQSTSRSEDDDDELSPPRRSSNFQRWVTKNRYATNVAVMRAFRRPSLLTPTACGCRPWKCHHSAAERRHFEEKKQMAEMEAWLSRPAVFKVSKKSRQSQKVRALKRMKSRAKGREKNKKDEKGKQGKGEKGDAKEGKEKKVSFASLPKEHCHSAKLRAHAKAKAAARKEAAREARAFQTRFNPPNTRKTALGRFHLQRQRTPQPPRQCGRGANGWYACYLAGCNCVTFSIIEPEPMAFEMAGPLFSDEEWNRGRQQLNVNARSGSGRSGSEADLDLRTGTSMTQSESDVQSGVKRSKTSKRKRESSPKQEEKKDKEKEKRPSLLRRFSSIWTRKRSGSGSSSSAEEAMLRNQGDGSAHRGSISEQLRNFRWGSRGSQ